MTIVPLARFELGGEAARQHHGGEEIDLEHRLPVVQLGLEQPEPRAARALGRDRGVVDQRVEPAVLEPLAHLVDGARRVVGVGEVDLQMILGAGASRDSPRERRGASR